jgi:WD40 repeat protein/serine/threonine protein kinase
MNDTNPSAVDPLGQIADEFLEAFRQGKRPSVEEFAQRYPEHADAIRDMLPALLLMEQAKTADDTPGQKRQATVSGAAAPLQQLGDYQILREVGRGGMGVVYEAQQLSLGRHVAIKVLPAHALLDPRHLGRFQREARSAARLHHTNIVPVFGVGEHEGLHYYVMQFIPGLGLDTVLDELRRLRQPRGTPAPTRDEVPRHPTNAARDISAVAVARGLLSGAFPQSKPAGALTAALGEPAAQADLAASASVRAADKSATIRLPGQSEISTLSDSGQQYWQSVARVGMQVADALAHAAGQGILHRDIKPSNLLLDDTGNVWVTDFGLAKAAGDNDNLTHTGDIVGTLRYMAPERFNGQGDLRSDIYSLGLTMYELAGLRPAFAESDRNRLIKQVTMGEPEPLGRVRQGIPRDLETIIHRAIERDPARRYQKAEDLTDDLRRFLDDLPVKARRTSVLERLVRWARRNRGVAASLSVIAVLLIGVAIASSLAALRFERLADEANRRGEAERRQRYRANMTAAAVALQVPNTGAARRALAAAPEEYRGWEWLHFNGQLDDARAILRMPGVPPAVPYPTGGALRPALAFSRDGKRIASGSPELGTVGVWDTATGREAGVLSGQGHYLQDLAFGPDGCLLAFTADGMLRSWDLLRNDRTILCRIPETSLTGLLLSPDGRLLLGVHDKHVQLWDVPAGRKRAELPGEFEIENHAAVFSSDGRLLAYSTLNGSVHLWDVQAGAEACVLRGPAVQMRALAFSPDGKRLAAGTRYPDNSVRLWSVPAGEEVPVPRGHQNEINTVAFSPDGSRLASGSLDKTARLWDARAGTLVNVLKGHTGIVRHTAFSPDGTRLATASDDETVRLWNAADGELVAVLRGHTGMLWGGIAFSPDGALLASASQDATVRLWDVGQLERNGVLRGHTDYVYDVAFSPDGTRAVSAAWDGTARLWDPDTGRETGRFEHGAGRLNRIVAAACFSPDGRQVATVTGTGAVTVWDVATGEKVRTLRVPPGDWRGYPRAAFQPHGTYLAVAAGDGAVRLWDAAGEEPVAVLRGPGDLVLDVAFSPDGTQLASAGVDGTVRLWDVQTRSPLAVLPGHETDWIYGLAYSPDGRLLASASKDKTVRVWDTATHEALAILPHGSAVYGVAFSPDGRRLAAGCADNSIRLWDVATARGGGGKEVLEAEVAELHGHDDYVHAVAWSPDGTRLISASGDRTVRIWDSLSAHERARRAAR